MNPAESIASLLKIWAALLALLALTCASAFVHLGAWNTVTNVSIAIAKAVFVMAFFMHLKSASPMTRVFGCAAFVWVLLLFGLTLSDVVSR